MLLVKGTEKRKLKKTKSTIKIDDGRVVHLNLSKFRRIHVNAGLFSLEPECYFN